MMDILIQYGSLLNTNMRARIPLRKKNIYRIIQVSHLLHHLYRENV